MQGPESRKDPETLGELISQTRRDLEQSREVAAVMIGTNSNTLADWEKDDDYPRKTKWIDALAKWADSDPFTIYGLMRATQAALEGPDEPGTSLGGDMRGSIRSGSSGDYTEVGREAAAA